MSPQSNQIDETWYIKSILWPPHGHHQYHQPRQVKIILQNSNGPCSLLAISNVLLLRGSINLPGPLDRRTISFQTLSSILADYLINQIHPTHHHLHNALSVIPLTRTGLDLNPRFVSIHDFRSDQDGRLDLFSAVGIDLLHGWLADPQDHSTYQVILNQCSDYDQAVELVAIAQELLSQERSDLSPDDQLKIDQAQLIKKFLDSTPTQLSYSGLFQLASELKPDSLAALLRNSHLSVLYRRPSLPINPVVFEPNSETQPCDTLDVTNDDQSDLPKLFTLVTDLSFLNEDQIVWESLEDVEGGLSEFFDWKLERTRFKTQNPHSGQNPESNLEIREPTNVATAQDLATQTDFDLAHQLQQQEYRTASNSHHTTNPTSSPSMNPTISSSTATTPSSNRVNQSSKSQHKSKKKDCLIM